MKPSNSLFLNALTLTMVVIACGGISGCKTVQSLVAQEQEDVSIVDSKSRDHLQARLTMADYVALAETVTNKMLVSQLVQGWGEKRPKVIAATPVNNTDNENVRMKDLHDRIQETLFGSGVMRVVDKSATEFDYVIKSELTSTRQYGEDGKELVHFTLQLKMFTVEGELQGQWSDDLAMAKSAKSAL